MTVKVIIMIRRLNSYVFAYAYGDGKELSAKNQAMAVERFIYNIPINTYYAIDFSSLKILNDDIGGVTLTPEYTFSSFTKGQKLL